MIKPESTTKPICRVCKKAIVDQTQCEATTHSLCASPMDTPLPPAPFKSKVVAFDVFAVCSKCGVKKYINQPTKLCFACHGFPGRGL